MRLRAPGEYLIGKHSGGFRGDKKNGGQGEDPPLFYFFFPPLSHHCSFIHPPSISKTFIAVIERGEES